MECEDLDDLWQKIPDGLILLRQSATAAQCSIDRRQRSVQQAGHLPLFATGSPQLSHGDVGEIANKFLAFGQAQTSGGYGCEVPCGHDGLSGRQANGGVIEAE